jgi:hypothetical protein
MKKIVLFILLLLATLTIVSQTTYAYVPYGTKPNWNDNYDYDTHLERIQYEFSSLLSTFTSVTPNNNELIFGFSVVTYPKIARFEIDKPIYFYLAIPISLLNELADTYPGDEPSEYVNIRIYNSDTSTDYFDDSLSFIIQSEVTPEGYDFARLGNMVYLLQIRLPNMPVSTTINTSIRDYYEFSIETPLPLTYDHYIRYGVANVVIEQSNDNLFVISDVLYNFTFDNTSTDDFASGVIAGRNLGRFDLFTNGSEIYGYNETDSFDYAIGQDDFHQKGSVFNGYTLETSHDYRNGLGRTVNSGQVNFMEGFERWIVPAIILIILLGGFFSIRNMKRDE